MRVSACADCGTTLIGEAPRCPACHAVHARSVAEDAITVPRPRGPEVRIVRALAVWLFAAEVVVATIIGGLLVMKGCS